MNFAAQLIIFPIFIILGYLDVPELPISLRSGENCPNFSITSTPLNFVLFGGVLYLLKFSHFSPERV